MGSRPFYSRLLLFTSLMMGTCLFNSCQLLGPYKSPLTPVPDAWKGTYHASDAASPILSQQETSSASTASHQEESTGPRLEDVRRDLCNWWEIFDDPMLNQLEEQALNASYTLWEALERVIQARAIARVNLAPLFPAIDFGPSFNRNGSLTQNNFSGLLDGQQQNTPSTYASNAQPAPSKSPTAFRLVQTQYLLPLNLNYEIDLWGQLNNAYYAALIRAQAASQAYLSVLLSLTADIASAYFQLRSLDAQYEVIQKTIVARQHAVEINQARFNAGLIVYLDVSRAEAELARAKADGDEIRRLRGLQENLIATLVGTPASIFAIECNPVYTPPPVIPQGLPSELLCRRPDIGEAERNLAAAHREIGVAYANFFPSVSLNASLGLGSPFVRQLFDWKARYWQIAANLLQTVFDAGRNQANFDYYKAVFREKMARYQQTVLQAFQDVEDALVNLIEQARQSQDLADAVKASLLTLELAQIRYDRGLINYLDVVDAERQLLETEQRSVITLGNRYVATVQLVRALGGGWDASHRKADDDQ